MPQTTVTASPMNLSTTPPYRPITVRATAKYSDSSSRSASGSRASDNGVNPATSQNSTEHTRRSAGGAATADEPRAARGPAATTARACPHDGQNRSPGRTGWPHDGHPPKGAPHAPQKRSPSPRDAPHRGHVTTRHLYPGAAPRYMAAPTTIVAARPGHTGPGSDNSRPP